MADVDPRFASVDCVFFVIGAQKAGTTWLSRYFKVHPNVSVPEWKEHEYWNMVEGRVSASRMLEVQRARRQTFTPLRDLVARLPFTLHARRQRAITLALKATEAPYPPYTAYADVIFENRTRHTRAAGEVCPEYALLRPETFAAMAGLAPNVRFVFVLRDPVSRFISGVRHALRKTVGKKAVTADSLSNAIHDATADMRSRPVSLSRYDDTIRALEQSVPTDRMLFVFFEDLFDQVAIKEICDFLGIPFLRGNTGRKANRARDRAASVSSEDRAAIARILSPVYAFSRERFGRALPRAWEESAALC
jgi:hypothetical protein